MSTVLYPQVSPEEWCKQWPGVRVCTTKCSSCGGQILVSRPWISPDYVGFDVTNCSHCGARHVACQAISRKPEEWGIYE